MFQHACKMGLEGDRVEAAGLAVSVGSHQRLAQVQEPEAPAVRREAEEDWGKRGWR